MAGATVVPIDTTASNWKLTPDDLRRHLTPRSRALVLCTPCNPTGAVYSDAELAALAEVLADRDVAVIVDEIYARISYVPVGRWLRAAPDMADRSFIVDGVSKAYAMTGWRLGWMVGPPDLMEMASAMQSHLTSHPSSITQRAATYALQSDADVEGTVDEMVGTFRQRRDAIVAGLSAIDGLVCDEPDGAFYVFPDVRGLFGRPLGPEGRVVASSAELCAYLLDDALIVTVPGEAFGTPGFVRFSYALGMDQLEEGVARVQAALKAQ
jgi:aspartate aminotransferase